MRAGVADLEQVAESGQRWRATLYDHLHPGRLSHLRCLNLPNMLTWLRILAIPLVILLFYFRIAWADPPPACCSSRAAITDSLDGYLARRWDMTRGSAHSSIRWPTS